MEKTSKEDFLNFLKVKKNFPEDSFLFDHHIIDVVGKNKKDLVYADLAILDTESNLFLALIEFKKNISENLDNYNLYLRVLNNPDLAFYFVEESENENFKFLFSGKINCDKYPRKTFQIIRL